MTIEVLAMPWAEWATPVAGKPGFLYDVLIYARGRRHHHFPRLLQATRADHRHVAHICLDGGGKSFRFTLPACLGADKVKEIVARFHDAAMNRSSSEQWLERSSRPDL